MNNYPRYLHHQQHQAMTMEERYQQQQQQLDPSGFYYGHHHPDAVAAAAAAAINSRRIFFSPAYFDPDLLKVIQFLFLFKRPTKLKPTVLQSPPPAALEFLARIRGMIDVAKDKMSSRRFMPSLVDIPEEQLGNVYGASSSAGLRRNASMNQSDGGRSNYGTLKQTGPSLFQSIHHLSVIIKRYYFVFVFPLGQTLLKNSLKRNKTSGDQEQKDDQMNDDQQQLYRPVELRATNFLQKSPLPVRKSNLDGLNGQLYGGMAVPSSSIYTNPSIEDIYRSLDRLKSEPINSKPGKAVPMSSKGKKKTTLAEIAAATDSDAVSDLVSEAEAKMPKITAPKTYFEPDSLDRVNMNKSQQQNRSHLYQKNGKAAQQRAAGRRSDETNAALREEAAEETSCSAGYTSSTCTSVQSLSRVLPAEEAMEVGNQLFNMRTGAPTLPRPGPTVGGNEGKHIYDVVRQGDKSGLFINHEFRKPLATPTSELLDASGSSSSNESSSSKVTVLEDSSCPTSLLMTAMTNQSKLTIQVESHPVPRGMGGDDDEDEGAAFEPDTLERSNKKGDSNFRRQASTYLDSLERPVQQVKSTINQLLGNSKKTTAVAATSTSSGSNRSSAKTSPAPISPASAGSCCSSSGLGSSISATSQDWITAIKKEELPPPGSVVSLRQLYARKNPPQKHPHNHPFGANKPPEESNKKPAADPAPPSSPIPPPLPLKSPSPAPAIPRNLKPSPLMAPVHSHPAAAVVVKATNPQGREVAPSLPPKNGRSGSSGAQQSATPSASSKPPDPSPSPPPAKSPNVLERIAKIEQESRATLSSSTSSSSGQQTKGMEIALALKARMAAQQQQRKQQTMAEGPLRTDSKKTNSLKKKWRKLLDKVEDSFSETSESAVSTLVRSSKGNKKQKQPAVIPPDEETADDSSSTGSLGSDGTGQGGTALTTDDAKPQLKSYYTFGQDLLPGVGKAASSPASSAKSATAAASGNKLYSTYQTSIGDY